jgi:hypothetical protein
MITQKKGVEMVTEIAITKNCTQLSYLDNVRGEVSKRSGGELGEAEGQKI